MIGNLIRKSVAFQWLEVSKLTHIVAIPHYLTQNINEYTFLHFVLTQYAYHPEIAGMASIPSYRSSETNAAFQSALAPPAVHL